MGNIKCPVCGKENYLSFLTRITCNGCGNIYDQNREEWQYIEMPSDIKNDHYPGIGKLI
jgi:rubredoxin